jgi:hypothetical protein
VLAVRIRRHLTDRAARPGPHPRPAGARRRPPRTPLWHESTGLYGFLRLPPGELRIEIDDPAGRFQAQAVTRQVPDRGRAEALEAGTPPAGQPRPLILDVALRPALGMALPPAPAPCGAW